MKKYILLHSLCLFVSLVLYYKAPNEVEFLFNLACFAVFLIQAIIILREEVHKDGILNFNMLFLFSFFFVTYAFPLLIWGTPLFESEGIQAYIDYNVACKCTALCTVAVSAYFLSYHLYRNKSYSFGRFRQMKGLFLVNTIYFIAFLGILYKTIRYISSGGGIAVDVGQWYNIYMASLPLSLMFNTERCNAQTFSQFLAGNKVTLLLASILMILFFILGDRGLVIISAVIIVGIYYYKVQRIKTRVIVLGVLIGSLLMFASKVTRTTEVSLSSGDAKAFVDASRESFRGTSFIIFFSDLTQIHRELYIGYEYHERMGLLEPKQFVIIPFYPFPVVPSLMSRALFGKDINDIKPGVTLNNYMAYAGHSHFGIHCVIDVFMRYGLLGVVLIFFLWGYLVAIICKSRDRSVIGFAMFIILLASAIRLPRAPLLDITRIFFWMFIVVWISGILSSQKKSYNRSV